MANIFISYKREQREWVTKLVEALEKYDLTVWWDPKINVGEGYFKIINKVIAEADCVLVVWSYDSIDSSWVMSEAKIGMERKNIIPILRDDVMPPLPFNIFQNANLINWDGDTNDKEFQQLLSSIQKYCTAEIKTEEIPAEEIGTEDIPVVPLLGTKVDKDSQKWKETLLLDTKKGYKEYLEVYPQGAHVKKAKKRLRRLLFRMQMLFSSLIIGVLAVLIIVKKLGE